MPKAQNGSSLKENIYNPKEVNKAESAISNLVDLDLKTTNLTTTIGTFKMKVST